MSEATIILESDFSNAEYPDLVKSVKNGVWEFTKLPVSEGLLSRIIGSCRVEWAYEPSSDPIYVADDSEIKNCQLCGATSVKVLHLVRNQKHDKELWVGNECVKKHQFTHHEQIKIMQQRRKETVMYEELSGIFPGLVDEFFHGANAYYHTSEYLLPRVLESENRKIFQNIRNLSEEYANADENDKGRIVAKIRAALAEYHQSKHAIDQYQIEASTNWLCPKSDYLKCTPKAQIVRIARNGQIDKDTLADVIHPDFSREKVLPRLNAITKGVEILFDSVEDNRPQNIAYCGAINSYRISLGHKQLFQEYADDLISDRLIQASYLRTLLRYATVIDAADIRKTELAMFSIIRKWGYRPVCYSTEFNTLFIMKEGVYIRLKLSETQREIMPSILAKMQCEIPRSIGFEVLKKENQMSEEKYTESIRMSSFQTGNDNDDRIDPSYIML